MDAANRPEEKLMTFAAKWYKKEIESLKQPAVNPPSTLKNDAAMEKRRQELEFKLYQEQMKAWEEMERDYKMKWLT
jgi:RecG-like helicase